MGKAHSATGIGWRDGRGVRRRGCNYAFRARHSRLTIEFQGTSDCGSGDSRGPLELHLGFSGLFPRGASDLHQMFRASPRPYFPAATACTQPAAFRVSFAAPLASPLTDKFAPLAGAFYCGAPPASLSATRGKFNDAVTFAGARAFCVAATRSSPGPARDAGGRTERIFNSSGDEGGRVVFFFLFFLSKKKITANVNFFSICRVCLSGLAK